jgi:hypothetical protein
MSLLTYFLMVIAIMTTLAWLHADARKPPPSTAPGGVVELRHGKKYLILAVACLVIGPGMMIAAFLTGAGWTTFDMVGFAVLTVTFAIAGTWMVLDALKTRVTISSDGVRAVTPFGGERWLKWNEIQTVGYNPFGPWLLLRGSGRPPIRVHRHLLGSGLFLRRLRAELGPGAFRGFARLLAPTSKDAA